MTAMRLIPTLLLLSIIILITACDKDDLGPCANVMPACDCGSLLLLDRWGQPVIGQSRTYHPDSIKMLNAPEKWNLRVEDSLIYFNYGQLLSDTEYYLYLSSAVQDTITLYISSQPGKCFTTKSIVEFSYSGARTTIDGDKIEVVKI